MPVYIWPLALQTVRSRYLRAVFYFAMDAVAGVPRRFLLLRVTYWGLWLPWPQRSVHRPCRTVKSGPLTQRSGSGDHRRNQRRDRPSTANSQRYTNALGEGTPGVCRGAELEPEGVGRYPPTMAPDCLSGWHLRRLNYLDSRTFDFQGSYCAFMGPCPRSLSDTRTTEGAAENRTGNAIRIRTGGHPVARKAGEGGPGRCQAERGKRLQPG